MDSLLSYPVVIGAVGVAAAYMLVSSSSSSSPSSSAKFVVKNVASSPDELDALINSVAANSKRWLEVPLQRKLEYLMEMEQLAKGVADPISAASGKIRHLEDAAAFENTGAFFSSGVLLSQLRGYIEFYDALIKTGAPPLPVSTRTVKDADVAQTAPRGLWQKITNPSVVEIWGQPGKKMTTGKYSPKEGVCAIMSPGNFESPVDALLHLFVEGHVVIVKSHPINAACVDPLHSVIFSSLVRDGFVGLCAGGPEVGSRILNHPKVDSWMMTGGCATFDAIVWGGKAAKESKNRKQLLSKTCHAELGAASPYIISPGNWTDQELDQQATLLAGYKMLNSGHVCASPQIVVVDRQWPLAQRFSDAVEQKLKDFPLHKPYYVGTADRMAAVKANCPATRVLGVNSFHFVPDVDAEGGGGSYMLQNEVFGPAISFKYLDGGNDPIKFWNAAAEFSNTKVFGSLSLSVVVAPSTIKAVGKDKFEEFIYK